MKSKKFLKHCFSAFLSGIMVFATVANPLSTVVSNAYVTDSTDTEKYSYTVTDGGTAQHCIFRHKHNVKGTYRTNVPIMDDTTRKITKYNGYTKQSPCYWYPKQHTHTDTCYKYTDETRYGLKQVTRNGEYVTSKWKVISAWDNAFVTYSNAADSSKSFDTLMKTAKYAPVAGTAYKDYSGTYKGTLSAYSNWSVDFKLETLRNMYAFCNFASGPYFDDSDTKHNFRGFNWFVDWESYSSFATPKTFLDEMWQRRAYGTEEQHHNNEYWWIRMHETIDPAEQKIYRVYTTHPEDTTTPTYTWMYYDDKNQTFVGNYGGTEVINGVTYTILWRDQESPFSIPNLLYQPYYWVRQSESQGDIQHPSSETFKKKTNEIVCGSEQGPIYVNSCTTNEGTAIGDCWVSATGAAFSWSLKNVKPSDSNLVPEYEVHYYGPDGKEVKTAVSGALNGTNAKTGTLTCTDSGTYKITVTVKSKVKNTNDTYVDNDTVTFTYKYVGPSTVTFWNGNPNGTPYGTVLVKKYTGLYSGGAPDPAPDPRETPGVDPEGYKFRGYYTKKEGPGTEGVRKAYNRDLSLNIKDYIEKGYDYNFYAWYDPIELKINYHLLDWNQKDGAKVPDSVDTHYDDAEIISSEENYDKYTFYGWYTTNYPSPDIITDKTSIVGQRYQGGDTVVMSEDLDLYGAYIHNKTVKYRFASGNEKADAPLPSDDENIPFGAEYKVAKETDYSDYVFDGWYLSPDCSGDKYNANDIIKTDTIVPIDQINIIFYGKYTKVYNVSYEFGTGNEYTDRTVLPESVFVKNNTEYTAETAKAIPGYTFDGWYTDRDCTTKFVNGTKITNDIMLYGKYTLDKYTVSYAAGNGNEKADAVFPAKDENIKYGVIYTAKPANEYTGYTFDGWYTNKDCTTKYTDTKITKNTVLYGKYTEIPPIMVDVSYAFGNGNEYTDVELPETDSIVENTAYTAKTANTVTGYNFAGWYTDKACTTKFVDGSEISENTVLYGKYTAKSYAVTYKLGKGSEYTDESVLPAKDTVKYGQNYTAKAAKDVTGYTFDGWYTNVNCTGDKYTGSTISGDLTLYGKYTANELTVSYAFGTGNEYQDKTVLPSDDTVKYGSVYTSKTANTVTGYTFNGWYTDEACSTEFVDGSVINEDTVLYGKYIANKYTVSYAAGTGNEKTDATFPAKDTNIKYGTTYTAKSANEYTGYTFDGWYTNKACTTKFTDGAKITKNTVLYGKYTANDYTVEYRFTTDNENPDAELPTPNPVNVKYGEEYEPAAAAVFDDYTFDGWYLNEDLSGDQYTGSIIEDNLILYGKYSKIPDQMIVVKYAFGTGNEKSNAVLPKDATIAAGSEYTSAKATTYTGYAFDGWYTDKACATKFVDGTQLEVDTILYGKYTANELTVSYAFGDGNENTDVTLPTADTVEYGNRYNAKSAETAEGYEFDGWYTDKACTTKFTDGTSITKNTVLYGKYVANELEVSYAFGTGSDYTNKSILPASDNVKYNTEYTAKTARTTTGYTFDGWYIDENCTTKFVDGTKITKDTVLYGKYIAKNYTINYAAGTNNEKEDAVFPEADINVKYGTSYTAKDATVYDNYTFDGWYTDKECTVSYTNGKITKNLTLYGNYTAIPAEKVSVEYAFGTGNENTSVKLPTPDIIDAGTEYTAKTANTATGYVFNGWYTDKACTTKFTNGSVINENTVLYGKYVARNYTVTYAFGTGNENTNVTLPSKDTVKYNTEYTSKSATVAEGYAFDGWYTDLACTTKFTDGTKITKNTVLYGKYTANDQTIKYQAGNGNEYADAVFPADDTAKYNSTYTPKTANKYTGYTFDGWYENKDLTGDKYTSGTVKGDFTLYGKYTANDQTVKYEFGTGNEYTDAVLPESETVKFGSDFTPATANTYDGYTFDGWYTTEGCTGNKYVGGKIDGDLTLYGKYTANDQTVHYELTGANEKSDATVPADETVKYNSSYTAKSATTYTGYTFDGWYDNKELTGTKYTTGTIKGDLTLYGKYAANEQTITYAFADGNEKADAVLPESETVKYDSDFTPATANTYDGYAFDGWYLTKDCSGDKYTGGKISSDLTLYGKYVANAQTIKYELTPESECPDAVVPTPDVVKYGTSYTAKEAPVYEGYAFDGWYDNKNLTGDKFTTKTVESDITLYGKYIANEYTVSYDFGENNEKDDITLPTADVVKHNTEYTAKTAPTSEGYTFDGWYTDKECTTKFVDGTKITGNVVLYGNYILNAQTVKYELVPGNEKDDAVIPNDDVVKYDTPYTAKNPENYDRYEFDGWYTDKDCTTKFVDGTKITEDITLYGKYVEVPYKIFYNLDEGAPTDKNIEVFYEDPYSLPKADVSLVPTKPGSTFEGWFLEDGTKVFNADGTSVEDVYKYTSDIYVYAKFKPNVSPDIVTPPPSQPQVPSNNNPAPPANDGGKKKIQTDDMNNPAIYLVLITLFASAGVAVIATKKKKEED